MIVSIADAVELAGTHIGDAFGAALNRSRPSGYRRFPSGAVLLMTGDSHPLSNCAIGLADDEVDPATRALVEANLPSMLTFTSPQPSPMEDTVEEMGFAMSMPTPAMAVRLSELPSLPIPEGYKIRRITIPVEGQGWCDAISASFNIPNSLCDVVGPDAVGITSSTDENLHYYEAVFDGITVAGSMMLLEKGVAGMYCIGTVDAHRGRGLGALLTAIPLLAARDLGYHIGVLQASKMGQPVYERIGFQRVGEIRNYFRMPT